MAGLPLRWRRIHLVQNGPSRFPEVHRPSAVLLPESFRGGCSFGPLLRQGYGGRLPRGIVWWPSPQRLRRTRMLRGIIGGAEDESTKVQNHPDLFTFLAHILSGTSIPSRSRTCVNT